MNRELIIFDLDGTLNCTELHAVDAQQEAMRKMGLSPATPELIISTFGAPSSEYTKILVPTLQGEEVRRYLDYTIEFDEYYLKKNGRPYSGVTEMLSALKKLGMQTAVCSNSSVRYISCVLSTLKIDSYIDYIQPRIKPYDKNYSLSCLLKEVPHTIAVMVGDTKYDMQAAEENEIPFIGCLYGYGKLDMQKAVFQAETPLEILDMVKQICNREK